MSELVVALDFPSQRKALELVDELGSGANFYKVGLELFTREGPGVVRALHGRSKRVFLDLKLFDIPNTVARAVESIGELEVELLTLHTSGGTAMMEAAVEAAPEGMGLLGVTVLTSFTPAALGEVWDRKLEGVQSEVVRLGRLAREAGLAGVVASAQEATHLRNALGDDLAIVTPGIRLADGDAHDQARVTTPESAVAAGATHLVVGRPITRADDPTEALARFRAALDGAGGDEG